MAKVPKINNAHGPDTRNIINRAIDVLNQLGVSTQDLVAEGQLTPTQYASLIKEVNSLLSKGEITADDFDKSGRLLDGTFFTQKFLEDISNSEINIDTTNVLERSISQDKIEENAVSDNETSFLKPVKNLVNPEEIEQGKFLRNDGTLANNASYDTSGYIAVNATDRYRARGLRNVVLYNKENKFHSFYDLPSGAELNQIFPINGFIRASFSSTYNGEVQIETGSAITNYEPFKRRIKDLSVGTGDMEAGSVTSEKIKKGSVAANRTDFIKEGKNLLDPDRVHRNKLWAYLATGEVLQDNNSYHASHKIYVDQGENISISYFRSYSFYASDGTKGLGSSTAGTNVTLKSNVSGYLIFSFEQDRLSSLQVERGTSNTPYEEYIGYYLDESIKLIGENSEQSTNKSYTVEKNEGKVIISTELDGKELRFESEQYGSANDGFSFVKTTYDGAHIHSTHDDITPVRTFSTVGGNHGYISVISLANTNKVTADLGSVWTDGTNEFVLLRIVNGRLIFGCPYEETANGVVSSRVIPSSNLSHVRNATNTQSISIAGLERPQLYPSTGKVFSQYKVDGKVMSADGVYSGDEVTIIDSYDILDYKAIIEWSKSNVGKDYASNRNGIDGVLRMSNTYQYYDNGKCRTSHSIYVLKDVTMKRTGVLQSNAIQHPTQTVYRYVHNVDTVEGINFKTPINLSTYNTNCNVTRANLIDSSKPVDRYIDYIGSGSNKLIAFTMGHVIDKTNSKHSDRMTNISNVFWDLRSTRKSYPTVIENKNLKSGEYYNFQGYRDYYIPKSSTLNSNVSSDKSADYIYIDEQSSGSFKAVKDDSLIGKELELIDSRNFELLSEVADSQGIAYRTTGSNSYGVIKAK